MVSNSNGTATPTLNRGELLDPAAVQSDLATITIDPAGMPGGTERRWTIRP